MVSIGKKCVVPRMYLVTMYLCGVLFLFGVKIRGVAALLCESVVVRWYAERSGDSVTIRAIRSCKRMSFPRALTVEFLVSDKN